MRLITRYYKIHFSEVKDFERPTVKQDKKIGKGYTQNSLNNLVLERRIQYFVQIKQKLQNIFSAIAKPQITITNGKQIKGQAFVTTPLDIAKCISRHLSDEAVVAKVKYSKKYDSPLANKLASAEVQVDQIANTDDYELVDLTRTLQGDCTVELLTFDDQIGKQVFWHSTAHIAGQSLQNNFGAWLCHGPAITNGFFYDAYLGNHKISQANYEQIQKQVQKYCREKQNFDRIVLTKAQALNMFSYNPFKVQLIQKKVPENGLTSAYRCGSLIDLCMGPHLPSTDKIKAFKITKNSSAYWLANKQNDDLQRVYGISYPKVSQLQQYVKQQEQLLKRDHRNIGSQQKLFNFTNLSPGCALFFPHGTIIYNRLVELMRSQYKIRGYSEVITPNLYNSELWKTSGHYFKYQENMFNVRDNGEQNSLKPMNCPGHCLMFGLMQHSYRDLPIRMADFGVLHRNELQGSLTGLTRVRKFQQDDAHIFCTVDQIQQQILGVLDLINYIYSIFNFRYSLELSTRPQKYLGQLEDWNLAENQLKEALKTFGKQYKINEADGAFYGPKIDVKLFDVFGRQHQCGTIQLDFQLPARFNLQYRIKQVRDKQYGLDTAKNQTDDCSEPLGINKITSSQAENQKNKEQNKNKKRKTARVEQDQNNFKGIKSQESANCIHHQLHATQNVHNSVKHKESLSQMEARYARISPLKKGFARPVIIHRAVFGSLQRFIAILCEHTGGKWDFWISPRQIILIPIGKEAAQFTQQVYNSLLLKGYSVEVDKTSDNFNKKIRNAQLASFNFIGVIGKEQVNSKSINLRKRDQSKQMGKFSVDQLLKLLSQLQPPKSQKRRELQKKSFVC